jgi:sugar phosphate permease
LDLIRGGGAHTAGHGHVPWRKLFSSRQVLMLCAQYFCLSYGWYFYVTWLPTYLQQARHLQLGRSAVLSALPLFFGGVGCLVAGFVATRLTRLTGSTAATRKLLAFIGFPGAALLLVLSTRMPNPVTAMLAIGLASFCNDLVMPGAWGACMDVGGRFAGTVSGMMNTMGNFGGSLCPVAVGYILSLTHKNWDVTFYVSAAIYVMGIFCWMALDPVTPLESKHELEPAQA